MIRTLKQLFAIIGKNLTILFRNWTSFLLLIVGPAVLILLLGAIYGNTDPTGIVVGVSAPDDVGDTVVAQFRQIVDVRDYSSIKDCVDDIILGDVSICAHFSDDFSLNTTNSIPRGNVWLSYDNSKIAISNLVVGFLKTQFGLTSDQLSLQFAQQLFTNLEKTVDFMNEGALVLRDFSSKVTQMRNDLESIQVQLRETQTRFEPTYQDLLLIQAQAKSGDTSVEQQARDVEAELVRLSSSLGTLSNQLLLLKSTALKHGNELTAARDVLVRNKDDIQQVLDENEGVVPPEVGAFLNIVAADDSEELNASIFFDIADQSGEAATQVSDIKILVDGAREDIDSNVVFLPDALSRLDLLVTQAQAMNDFLSSSLGKTNTSIEALQTTEAVLVDFADKIELSADLFENIDASSAKQLINPIEVHQEPLLKNKSTVYLMFPIILPIIIVFLSILFSNIIMLDEIYSSAQIRNFIIPMHDQLLLVGFYFTNIFVTGFQAFVVLLFASFGLDIPIAQSLFPMLLFLWLLMTIFTFVGMTIAYATESKENSILMSTVVSVGVFLFSDILVPLEMMKTFASFVVELNPLVITEGVFRKILLHDLSLWNSLNEFLVLFAYAIILYCVLYIAMQSHKRLYK